MDFFSSTTSMLPVETGHEADDPFAEAIRSRFNTVNGGLLTSHLLTPASEFPFIMSTTQKPKDPISPPPPSTPLQKLTLQSSSPNQPQSPRPLHTVSSVRSANIKSSQHSSLPAFLSITPDELPTLLADSRTMLIDIRAPSVFDASHLTNALSLAVPSTLLKRPGFKLSKISTMLPSASAKAHFDQWPFADRIIAIDSDSGFLAESSNISGLLRKFLAEGFVGSLVWVTGGFNAVTNAALSRPSLSELLTSRSATFADIPQSSTHGFEFPRARNLPHSAFEQSSTTIAGHRPQTSGLQAATPHAALTCGSAPPPTTTRIIAANPFYDNIRQMSELSQGISDRLPLQLRPEIRDRVSELPFAWLKELGTRSDAESAEDLAMQFYKVELAEQRRMMGIMEEHTKQSQQEQQANPKSFPFSITAGIEKGSKNRYSNIWPFEHARVHLQRTTQDGSDYVNASFVQPLTSSRKYIATQGPLPATFDDFWRLIWEQNSRVIVMLTKRFEGASIKCGSYWPTPIGKKERYGDYLVETVAACSESSENDAQMSFVTGGTQGGFDFGNQHPTQSTAPFARRTFSISNACHPDEPSRHISHFQFLDWPDLDVPSTPQSLLRLIREVNTACSKDTSCTPIVLHCSAGVGRTGGYILIDAVLDALRRELRSPPLWSGDSSQAESSSDMDVDSRSSAEEEEAVNPLPSRNRRRPSNQAVTKDVNMNSLRITHDQTVTAAPDLFDRSDRPIIRRRRISSTQWVQPAALHLAHAFAGTTTSQKATAGHVLDQTLERDTDYSDVAAKGSVLPPSRALSFQGSTSTFFVSEPSLFSETSTYATEATTNSSPKESPPLAEKTSAFDYIPPRAVSGKSSDIVSLTTLDEPIRQVLEGMREQRMSLCQTLRQFVFVHSAIIEGALEIMDEERAVNPSLVTRHQQASMKSLNKRPSIKRRDRSDSSLEEPVTRSTGRAPSINNKLLKSS